MLDTFKLSEPERASLLLHFRPLGNTRPSILMDEMLALLGDHPPCFLFRQLFLERLPEDMRSKLLDEHTDDHRQLAQKADQTWASRQMRRYANNVQTQQTPSSGQVPYDSTEESYTDRGANAVQLRTPTGSKLGRRQPPPAFDLCYYNRTFGRKARRCIQPCAWKENEQAGRL